MTRPRPLSDVDRAIRHALAEDIGKGDLTTRVTIPPTRRALGLIVARSWGIAAGLPLAARVFRILDPACRVRVRKKDGSAVRPGDRLLEISGSARTVLAGERVALNFLQHLSGIATFTHSFVRAVRGTRARILDTRKTTPGLRLLEKYAVRMGGGANHRMGLYDAILIKDNHIAAAGGILAAVAAARKATRASVPIEIEARTPLEVREAMLAGADTILLDNMTPQQLRSAVKLVGGRARTEASGGVTLRNVRTIARTGVNDISVGALTHSAPALDISLDLKLLPPKRTRPR
ncbi:MAG: carboxylating nicotinate-nucleotide diphosphorylase [Nitrospirota bacterium]